MIFFPLHVVGKHHIPRKGKVIIASNHVSYIDPPAVGVACPRVVRFMAREDLMGNPIARWALQGVGVIPLKRASSDINALKMALKKLALGEVIVLFPEGTRSADGEIKQGLEGVGFLARKSQAPVIPTCIKGAQKVMPKGTKRMHRHSVDVIFGAPILMSDMKGASDREITDLIMQRIRELKNSSSH